MSKKILLVVLALVLALSLCVVAGCGDNAVDDNNQTPITDNDNQNPDAGNTDDANNAGDDNQAADGENPDDTLLPTE